MNSKILMNSSVQKVNGIKHVVVLSNVLHSVPSSPRARPSSPSRVRWAAPKSPRRFVNCSLVCMDGKGCSPGGLEQAFTDLNQVLDTEGLRPRQSG